MKIEKFLVFSFFCIFLFVAMVQAQEKTTISQVPELIRWLSSGWLILIFLAFLTIVIAYFVKSRVVLDIGVILLLISIVFVIWSVVFPLLGEPTVTYEKCKTMFNPDISVLTVPGLFYTTSCVLTGYAPKNLEWLTIATFIIFGVILPIALLAALFYDFIPEGMITNENARRVIAAVGTLFAFRGFFASLFVEFLSYGFTGMGALFVAVLFTGYVWKAAYKFVVPVGEFELKKAKLATYEELARQYETTKDAYLAAIRANKFKEAEKFEKQMKELEKIMKKKGV
jgi:hypothetical protein